MPLHSIIQEIERELKLPSQFFGQKILPLFSFSTVFQVPVHGLLNQITSENCLHADETKPRYSPVFSFVCNAGYSEKRSEQFCLTYTDNVKSANQVSQRYIGIHRIVNF